MLDTGDFCINPRKGALRGLNNQNIHCNEIKTGTYIGLSRFLFAALLLHLSQKLFDKSLIKYTF